MPRAVIAGYTYSLADRLDRELFAYHWHPDAASWAKFRHLHLSGRLAPLSLGEGGELSLGNIHFPTERITVAAFVRLLIEQVAVVPRRTEWHGILAASDAATRTTFADSGHSGSR